MSAALTLAPGVIVHPLLEGGADGRIVEAPGGKLTRVGDDAGRLLDLLAEADGPATPEALAERLGNPWTAALVTETADRLERLGLAGAGHASARKRIRAGRIEYRAPMALQMTLLAPRRRNFLPGAVAGALRGRAAPLAAIALALAGVPVLAAATRPSDTGLHSPADLTTYLLALAGVYAAVAVHELAHGAVLAAHGGHPRRFGFMVFYLMPGFFCDVTEAWRLAPRARVRVALAGIVAQTALAGAAALASLAVSGDLRQGMLLFALITYIYGLGNLLPFVKLDGYVALTGGLDIPHLRRKAMDDFQSWLAHVLLGSRYVRSLPAFGWAPWFGAASTLAPLGLLGVAVATLGPALLPFGPVGAALALALGLLLPMLLGLAVQRFTVRALRAGASRGRVMVAGAALAFLVTVALAFVPVPRTVQGGYARIDGEPTAVLAAGLPADQLAPGRQLTIRRNGLLAGAVVGTAVTAGPARSCDAPIVALVPINEPRTTAAQCIPLSGVAVAGTGRLTAALPARPLGERLVERYLAPPLQALGLAD